MRTEDGYIIRKCLDGDDAAFGLLVDKYKESVYALAYSKIGNFHDAEDITQKVFIKAYKKLHTLKRLDSFLAWLYSITSNLCKNFIRSKSNRPDSEFLEEQEPAVINLPAINSYQKKKAHESLYEALNSLPEIYRQALTLYYLGGMSSKDIARFLGTSPNTIDKRLSRGRIKLKKEMLDIMNITFDQQKLQPGFTFRIVEIVKNIKAQSKPHTPWIPWGLSIATGIILTVLSFTLVTSFDLIGGMFGSAKPGQTKVIELNEFPVSILKSSNTTYLSGRQDDGNDGRTKLPSSQSGFLGKIETKPVQIIGKGRVYDVAVSPDGTLLAVQTSLGIELSDVERKTKPVLLDSSKVRGIAFSSDGKFLVSHHSREILVWDVHEKKLIKTIPFDKILLDRIREKFKTDLDNNKISKDLRNAFEHNDIVLSQNTIVKKKGKEWYVFNIDRDFLFSVDSKYKEELDAKKFSSAFIKEFESRDIPLAEKPKVPVHKQRSDRWIIGAKVSYSARLNEDKLKICNIHRDQVYVIRKESGKLNVFFEKTHVGYIRGMALNPASSEIAVACGKGKIMILDLSTGNWLRSLYRVHSYEWERIWESRISMQYSPDGQQLLILESSGANGKPDRIIVLDPHSGDRIHTISVKEGSPMSATYSPDSRWLAVRAWAGRRVEVWDTKDWKVKRVFEVNYGTGSPLPISFSPDGNYLALAGVVWNFHTKEVIRKAGLSSKKPPIRKPPKGGYSPYCQWVDNTRLLIGERDSLQISDITDKQPLQQIANYTDNLRSAYFLMHDKYILSNSGELTLWNTDTTAQKEETDICKDSFYPRFVAVSAANSYVAIPYNRKRCIQIWDAVKREVIRRIPYDGIDPYALEFSPDGKWLAVGESSYTTKLWNIKTGKKLHQFLNAEGLSANRLVIKLKQWRHRSKDPTKVRALAFSSDGQYLACASGDEKIWVWNTRTGELVNHWAVPIEQPYDEADYHPHTMFLKFSPDGRRLFAGLAEGRVDVWKVATGKLIKSVKAEYPSTTSDFFDLIPLAFSPDATLMAVGKGNSTVEVIDTVTWKKVAELEGHRDYISSVDFSSDGGSFHLSSEAKSTKLLTASGDGTIRIWKIKN